MSIKRKPCPRCKGTGVKAFGDDFDKYYPHKEDECARCHGTGLDEYQNGFEEMGVDEE